MIMSDSLMIIWVRIKCGLQNWICRILLMLKAAKIRPWGLCKLWTMARTAVSKSHIIWYHMTRFWFFSPYQSTADSSRVSSCSIQCPGSQPDGSHVSVTLPSFRWQNPLVNRLIIHCLFPHLPSGKQPHNYGKSPFSMGKSTISMAIFNSYVWHNQKGMWKKIH